MKWAGRISPADLCSIPLESSTTKVWASPYPFFFIFFDTTAFAILAASWNKLEGKHYLKPKPTNKKNKAPKTLPTSNAQKTEKFKVVIISKQYPSCLKKKVTANQYPSCQRNEESLPKRSYKYRRCCQKIITGNGRKQNYLGFTNR